MTDTERAGTEKIDGFVSYSRTDRRAADAIVRTAALRGRRFWQDSAGIPPAVEWRPELRRAIESADAVVCLLSEAWFRSPECQREVQLALELGKRCVPVAIERVSYERAAPAVRALQWIDATAARPDQVTDAILRAIDTDHERVREHTQLLGRALRWEQRGRDASLLARGRDLRAAEEWLARGGTDPQPTALHSEFVAASRRGERRRARRLLTAVSLAAVIALALAAVAVVQRGAAIRARNVAQSELLAARSQAELAVDPEIALILARDAWQTSHTDPAVAALQTAVHASLVRQTIRTGAALRDAVPAPGGTIVTVGLDGAVRSWQSGTPVSVARFGARPATSDSAQDGSAGILRSEAGRVACWSVRNGMVALDRIASGAVASAISPDGATAAYATDAGDVYLATGRSGWRRVLRGVGPGTPVSLSVSDGARAVAVGTQIGTAHTPRTEVVGGVVVVSSNLSTPRLAGRYQTYVASVQVSADAGTLTTQAADGSGVVQSLPDATVRQRFDGGFTTVADRAAHWVGIGGDAGAVQLLDVLTGSVRTLETAGSPIVTLAFDPDGGLMLSAGLDGQVEVWRTSDGTRIAALHTGRADALAAATFAGGGVVTAYGDGSVRRWVLPAQPALLPLSTLGGGAQSSVAANSVGVQPAGSVAITASSAGMVQTWDTATGVEICLGNRPRTGQLCPLSALVAGALGLDLPAALYLQAALGPDHDEVALLGGDGSVWLITHATTAPVVAWHLVATGSATATGYLAWSPDGRQLLAGRSGRPAEIVDVASHRVVGVLATGRSTIYCASWLPSGIVTADDQGTIGVYAGSGRLARTLPKLPDAVTALAASADGRRLAVAQGNDVDLLDARTGSVQAVLRGNTAIVAAVAYSADGSFVVSGGFDGTVRTWNAASGDQVESVAVGAPVTAVAITGSDTHVIAGGQSGTAWDLSCDVCLSGSALAALAADRITDPLTPAQGALFGLPTSLLSGGSAPPVSRQGRGPRISDRVPR